MKILLDENLPMREKTAIAVGLFDGFHAGHMALVDTIKKQGLPSLIFTFDVKPTVKDLIYTRQEKRSVAEMLGVEYYYECAFNEAFAHMSPEQFVEILAKRFCVTQLTVGFDFRFGRNAVGDIRLLEQMQAQYEYQLHVVPEVVMDGYEVSSSAIRKLLKAGNVKEAGRLLTRRYFIDGQIESGNQVGGTIGFPTANISTNKLLPSYGVYATLVQTAHGVLSAVTNVGTKPTVKTDDVPNVETYILDYDGNLYGSNIRVWFVEKIRDEKKFANIDALQAQIAQDSERARELLRNVEK